MTCVLLLVTFRNKQLNGRLEIAQRNNTLELNPYLECAKDIEVSEDDLKKQLGDTPHLESINEPIYESIDDSSSQQNESDDEILEEPKSCEDYES